MARDDLDELFDDGGAAPKPRTGVALALALGGLVVAVLGLACLSAPGGVMVLGALWWIDREHDRVENGYLPPEARQPVEWVRRVVVACLALVIGVFVLQACLYANTDLYERLGDLLVAVLTPPPDGA